MQQNPEAIIRDVTGAAQAVRAEVIQSLWSGYGEIVRYHLHGAAMPSVILKHVVFPSKRNHPRGWNDDRSHRRKVRSYQVEMAWYERWSSRCDALCRVPRCFASRTVGEEHLILLEDLDAAGFALRKNHLDADQAAVCLRWLAHFHAEFLGEDATGLWPIGTYWHLATRPDEWRAIEDTAIRESAAAIDAKLNACRFKTFVHGDAKVANFCFSEDAKRVAAVDFQYTGAGCGMKDVAYFLGSCLEEAEQERREAQLIDIYFGELRRALALRGKEAEADAIESEWRNLFPFAQADFYRFLVGWSPGHWKIHDYSRRMAMRVIARLQQGS